MATRKKYKIVLSEKYVRKSDNGKEWFQFPVDVSGQLVAIQTIIPLDPYNEPDLEQVRKEAYQKGYETEYEDGYNEPGKNQQEAYQRGLNDAWEAARWIADTTYDVERKIFDCCYWDVVKTFTAAEAIEKLKAYEQEQEKEFKVGDEFENGSGKKFVVLKMNGKEIDRYIDVDGKTYCMTVKYKEMRKTGRHFPEIATVLEKMREES